MSVILSVAAAAGVHVLAVVSPGPNFMVISRTALAHSRRLAMFVTLGVTTGAFLLIGSGFIGASTLITRNERVFDALRLAGAAYLVYLGVRAIAGAFSGAAARHRATETVEGLPAMSQLAAYRLGLLTIFSNAKAFVYFVVFFTAIVPPDLPVAARVALVVIMPLITLGWYSIIAAAFSGETARRAYGRLRRPIDIVFGSVLLVIGLEVAFA